MELMRPQGGRGGRGYGPLLQACGPEPGIGRSHEIRLNATERSFGVFETAKLSAIVNQGMNAIERKYGVGC